MVVVGGVMCLFTVLKFPNFNNLYLSEKTSAKTGLDATSSPHSLPDVYYLIADEYGRNDQLQLHTEYDNGKFLLDLKGRGFEILEEASANYYATDVSIPSILSMDYVAGPEYPNIKSLSDLMPILQGKNRVYDRFRSMGYYLVTSGSVFALTL